MSTIFQDFIEKIQAGISCHRKQDIERDIVELKQVTERVKRIAEHAEGRIDQLQRVSDSCPGDSFIWFGSDWIEDVMR